MHAAVGTALFLDHVSQIVGRLGLRIRLKQKWLGTHVSSGEDTLLLVLSQAHARQKTSR